MIFSISIYLFCYVSLVLIFHWHPKQVVPLDPFNLKILYIVIYSPQQRAFRKLSKQEDDLVHLLTHARYPFAALQPKRKRQNLQLIKVYTILKKEKGLLTILIFCIRFVLFVFLFYALSWYVVSIVTFIFLYKGWTWGVHWWSVSLYSICNRGRCSARKQVSTYIYIYILHTSLAAIVGSS